ncbi:MAG: hypothetical protein AAFZ58_17440 [Pseudomonadota bacterium]
MRPLTVLTGIVLGSAFSIAFGLGVVWLIFVIIGSDQPIVADEVGAIGPIMAMFSLLTAISATSFVAQLRVWRYRWIWQLAMWLGLLGIGWYFWPA